MLIKEEYKNQGKELSRDVAKIRIIRDAIAHGNFSFDENGFSFQNNKETATFSYPEFSNFLYKIENEFYNQRAKSF